MFKKRKMGLEITPIQKRVKISMIEYQKSDVTGKYNIFSGNIMDITLTSKEIEALIHRLTGILIDLYS